MAPRKVSDTAAEPRRSGRIAALPVAAPAEAPKPKATKAKATKKRSADDVDEVKEGETSAAKKAKADEAAAAEQGASDSAEGSSTSAALDKIELGGSLPSLTLKNEKGEDIQVADLANEKGVVLFLVPKADTPGCTNQACGFRDIYPDFTSVNFDVYCLSTDSPAAQTKWQTKKELPYPLISDPKRVLISALGAGEGGKTKRSHFIFEKGGKLVDKKLPVTPADSPKLALEFAKNHT